ncbi:MAG: citrate/2-methylcitrate synthase [Acidimicrobiales bacterium]
MAEPVPLDDPGANPPAPDTAPVDTAPVDTAPLDTAPLDTAPLDADGRGRWSLSAAEAAARLGIKRQTLYAYVSRGLIERRVDSDGRSSRFDPVEIERFRFGRHDDDAGELRTLLSTRLTRVADTGLIVRGRDLVGFVAGGARFADVVDLLWDAPADEAWPSWSSVDTELAALTLPGLAGRVAGSPLDELRLIVTLASARDPLRTDLAPRSVRALGRRLIMAMASGLGAAPGPAGTGSTEGSVAGRLWGRLATVEASPERVAAVDTALSLLIDHGLAASTFAARIAASVRADPYSVLLTALGVIDGPLHGGSSATVHRMLEDAARSGDPARAVGAARRQLGHFPGIGHRIYRHHDPRYATLLGRLMEAWAGDPRLGLVLQVRDLIGQRSGDLANVDAALGALTFLGGMPADAGGVLFSVGRAAGWLAHGAEEYGEAPLRFRARERYTGL